MVHINGPRAEVILSHCTDQQTNTSMYINNLKKSSFMVNMPLMQKGFDGMLFMINMPLKQRRFEGMKRWTIAIIHIKVQKKGIRGKLHLLTPKQRGYRGSSIRRA